MATTPEHERSRLRCRQPLRGAGIGPLQVEAESSIAIQLNEYLPAGGRPDGELMASLEPSTCSGSCVFSRSRAACRNRSRARDSVDITVPIGTLWILKILYMLRRLNFGA